MSNQKQITIFTDGASRGNPGPGGWGAVIVFGEYVQELGGREANTTNNRMELTAVIEALKVTNDVAQNAPTKMYTDSAYVLNGATKWLSGWVAKNWKTATKQPVLNQDLWEQIAPLLENRNIEWELLSGHVGITGNERCDQIATAFVDSKLLRQPLYNGPLAQYSLGTEILNVSHDAIAKEKRSESKSRSRAQAFSYISKVGGIVLVHKTWAECEKRVKGVPGALFKKALDMQDEMNIIREFKMK